MHVRIKSHYSTFCTTGHLQARRPHLVVQHQQQGAAHAHVAGPLHLEAVRLLGGGRAVPLKERTAAE